MTGNNTKENANLLLEAHPVNRSRLQGSDLEWMIHVATSPSTSYELLKKFSQHGSSSRMCLASCHRTTEGILLPSSEKWRTSGMGALTGYLTLNTSEFPKDADACLLSDILMEIIDVPQRFYLSQKACAGIIRRAERRGKKLPPTLDKALRNVANTGTEEE